MLKKIIIAIASLSALFLALGFVLPKGFEVRRAKTIHTSPEKLHTLVSDLKRWDEWTPWKAGDPSLTVEVGQVSQGVGATQTWKGDSGNGSLKITKDDPKLGIDYDITFSESNDVSKASIHYVERGTETEVIWEMKGKINTPFGGYLAIFMDGMVGGMLEDGLNRLKSKAENL